MKKNPSCTKKFGSYKSLRRHVQTCVQTKNDVITQTEIEKNATSALNVESSEFVIPHNDMKRSNINDESTHSIENETKSLDEFFDIFISNVIKLNLTYAATDSIFSISEQLLQYTKSFILNELKKNSEMSSSDVVNLTIDCMAEKVHKVNSAPKRDAMFQNDPRFVRPEEKSLGVHWEMKRNRNSKQMLPTQVQSKFQYVPITKTLISKFGQPTFKDLYVNYNFGQKYSRSSVIRKHVCEPDRYRDFCCGSVFKANKLFSVEPKSIQIQLYIDGFNVTDPLKSSSRIHDQIGIYFTIRNLPPEHAYNLNNIHLVALCHTLDMKNKYADYNNLWDEIVKDVSKLENVGLCISKELPVLKGKHFIRKINLYKVYRISVYFMLQAQ